MKLVEVGAYTPLLNLIKTNKDIQKLYLSGGLPDMHVSLHVLSFSKEG